MKRFAFLPGALMIAAAVLWAAFALRWTWPAVVLACGGLLSLVVGVAANWKGLRAWLADPRGVFALNTSLATIVLAAILILVNALAGLRGTTFDWTEAGRNTLAAESAALVRGLGTGVVMKQMGRPRDPSVRALLDAFAAGSPRVRVETVDIDAAPAEARRYGVTRAGSIVVESASRFRRVDLPTEPAIATAILQVTRDREPRVCFAAGEGGHGLSDAGPQGLSGLASVLAASGFRADAVSLPQAGVPGDCAVVVFAGMPNGLPAATWDAVNRYLDQGGRLLVAVDPPVDAGIAAFLARFGITTGHGVIVETSAAGRAIGAGPENPVSSEYRDHPVTRGFDERIILGRAVPLGTAPTEIGRPVALALTAATAFERVDLVSQAAEPREGRDRRGPFALAVATTIPRGSRDAALPEPRLIVTGDSDFLANGLITWRANREFAVRMVAWLAGEEEARVVAAGDRQNRRVPLTERRAAWMYVVNLGVLPLLAPAAGLIALWLRSRGARSPQPREGQTRV